MSGTAQPPDYWTDVQSILNLFFPQFSDPDNAEYVPSEILSQLLSISDTARPWCLPVAQQNIAQAYFTAYLVSLRNETSSGEISSAPVAGPIVSEKEGDISVTYADLSSTGATMNTISKRPPSDPWDVWNRYWMRCARGSITTRFGDPCKSAIAFTCEVIPIVTDVWRRIW